MSGRRHRSDGLARRGPGISADAAGPFRLFDAVGALVMVLGRDGEVVYWNRACQALSGYTLEAVRDPRDRSALLQLDRPELQAAPFTELREDRVPVSFENAWTTSAGQRREIQWWCTTTIETGAAVDLMFCTGFDITPRKLAEERLRLSEERLSGIVELATDAIVTVDANQRITLFNQGAERIFGASSAEMLGRSLDELLPPDVRTVHRRHFERFIARPAGARPMEELRTVTGRRKTGELFPAEVGVSSFTVGGQHVSTAVLRDVTRRRSREAKQRFLVEATAALASSLEYKRTLASVARLAATSVADFVIVDLLEESGEIRRLEVATSDPAKTQLAAALRQSLKPGAPAAVVGRVFETRQAELRTELPWADLADAIGIDPAYRESLQQLDPTWLMAVPLAAHNRILGAIVFLGCRTGTRFGDDDLQLAEALGRQAALAIDNARLFEAARRATAARDDILQVVAHELRNPLTAVVFSAHALEARSATEADLRSVRMIKDSVEEINRLIDDLLDEKLLAAGQMVQEMRPHSGAALVTAALEAGMAVALEVQLSAVVHDAEVKVLVDEHRIGQVFGNLIGNAVKFTPAGGHVEIGTRVENDEALFWVSDTGVGIAPEHLAHVFDRYWQATRPDRQGAGLGLPICKGIVEAHGGRIWVRSEAGTGSTFFFALPRAPHEIQASAG